MTMSEASVDDVTAFVCSCVFSFVCVALFFLRMLKPHVWPNFLLPVLNSRVMAASVSVLCQEIRWPVELHPFNNARNFQKKFENVNYRRLVLCKNVDIWTKWNSCDVTHGHHLLYFNRTLFKQTVFKVAMHLTRKVLWFLQEHRINFLTQEGGGGCNCSVPFLHIIVPSEVWYRCNPCSANCSPDKTMCLYVFTHSRVYACVC